MRRLLAIALLVLLAAPAWADRVTGSLVRDRSDAEIERARNDGTLWVFPFDHDVAMSVFSGTPRVWFFAISIDKTVIANPEDQIFLHKIDFTFLNQDAPAGSPNDGQIRATYPDTLKGTREALEMVWDYQMGQRPVTFLTGFNLQTGATGVFSANSLEIGFDLTVHCKNPDNAAGDDNTGCFQGRGRHNVFAQSGSRFSVPFTPTGFRPSGTRAPAFGHNCLGDFIANTSDYCTMAFHGIMFPPTIIAWDANTHMRATGAAYVEIIGINPD